MNKNFQIFVNDCLKEVSCPPESTLLDVLREHLRLTGTKRGCDIGVCGTCTVLIDGKPRQACRVKMKDLAGDEERGMRDASVASHQPSIVTIEGLENNGSLHPIQQAFVDCGAIQCGFCTPGMVLAAKALLDENPRPTRAEIRKALANNLCRCTGYQQIFEAIEKAAQIIISNR